MTVVSKPPAAARKREEPDIGISYFARRPLKLHGISYKPGDKIPKEAVEKVLRSEALIRCGLIREG